MADLFRRSQASTTPDQAESFIQSLVSWETQNGYGVDLTIAELATVAGKYLGSDVHTSVIPITNSLDPIRDAIRAGHPVIVPAAGRQLHNPYYTPPGPNYHMLVVTGFTQTQFITNDPGTKRGSSYAYDQVILLNGIHDWTGSGDTIFQGKKDALVIY